MKDDQKKDGGPSAPCNFYAPCKCGLQLEVTGHGGGMSMRQAYKIAAMQGELASQSENSDHYTSFEVLAIRCGDIATAMLAEDEQHERGSSK